MSKLTKKTKDHGGNMLLDIIMQLASAGVMTGLAWYELLRHIEAESPTKYILASIGIGFLLYNIFAPIFRHK